MQYLLLPLKTVFNDSLSVSWRFLQSSGLLIIITLFLLLFEFSIPALFFKLSGKIYESQNFFHLIFFISASFVFLFLIPIILNKFIYRKTLSSIGLTMPLKKNETFIFILVAFAILIPTIVFLTQQHQALSYYSFHKQSVGKLIFVIVTIFPLYYFFEEFFFRGFLLFNLWGKIRWHSLWVTDIIFTLAHLTKPLMEILIALPAGIILAFLTLRTKSIYPSVVVHYTLGTLLILIVNHII